MFGVEWLGIRDAVVFTPAIHADERGEVTELFSADGITAALGRSLRVTQAVCTLSRRGTLRGIHFTSEARGQAMFITCVSGSVLHAVVDVRLNSPGFGTWELVRLDGQTRRGLYLPGGLGHGYLVLSDQALVVNLRARQQPAAAQRAIHPLDPELGIGWPPEIEPVLPPEDAAAPVLAQARADGILPDYSTRTT